MEMRKEHDSLGEVLVPADKLYGAQTQRSFENFKIGEEKMPTEVVRALAVVKLASARANARLKPEKMTAEKLSYIEKVTAEILNGELDAHFPLSVWQTGSGTQSNMNSNEVIANRANQLAGKVLLHPNDDVNMSQSSNDTFPAAMHIAAYSEIVNKLLPAAEELIATFGRLEKENTDAVKCGRTHLQDATPITFAQEISGWRASIERDCEMIRSMSAYLTTLALGATAVGTGLNAPEGFDVLVADEVAKIMDMPFVTDTNKFHSLTSKGELASAHGAIRALAADLMKIANDVRHLASGPRCGLGEIFIPENEPGSSIRPGKVNPTQCEALTMVAVRVIANDVAVGTAASLGNFELNVFMPVAIYSFLQSVRLLSDAMRSFNKNCAVGIRANREKMKENLDRSLMTATALSPIIGYENAARVVHKAHGEGITIKEACLALGYLDEEKFDECYHPERMV